MSDLAVPPAQPALDDAKRELTQLRRDLQGHNDYLRVRNRYCELSIHMNLDGRLAPAFRPRPRAEAPIGDPAHMLVFRDQLVIDYHWFHANRIALSPKDHEHELLLDLNAEFNFAAAWALVHKVQKKSFRAAEALCLTPFQQCQTMQLHSTEMSTLLDRIGGGWRASGGKTTSELAKVKRVIGQWIEQKSLVAPERYSYECLWLAREMLGHGAPNQLIADLHALMVGKTALDRTTIRGKLKSLDKRISVA